MSSSTSSPFPQLQVKTFSGRQTGREVARGVYSRINAVVTDLCLVVKTARRPVTTVLVNEIFIASNFSHPHLVPIEGLNLYTQLYHKRDTYHLQYELVMQHCQTLNNKALLAMTLEERKSLTFQLLDALIFLEDNGVIHGDIKLDNIMLHQRRLVLMDFGLIVRTWWDHQVETQTYSDAVGLAYQGIYNHKSDLKYDQISNSMFALGITIALLMFPERYIGFTTLDLEAIDKDLVGWLGWLEKLNPQQTADRREAGEGLSCGSVTFDGVTTPSSSQEQAAACAGTAEAGKGSNCGSATSGGDLSPPPSREEIPGKGPNCGSVSSADGVVTPSSSQHATEAAISEPLSLGALGSGSGNPETKIDDPTPLRTLLLLLLGPQDKRPRKFRQLIDLAYFQDIILHPGHVRERVTPPLDPDISLDAPDISPVHTRFIYRNCVLSGFRLSTIELAMNYFIYYNSHPELLEFQSDSMVYASIMLAQAINGDHQVLITRQSIGCEVVDFLGVLSAVKALISVTQCQNVFSSRLKDWGEEACAIMIYAVEHPETWRGDPRQACYQLGLGSEMLKQDSQSQAWLEPLMSALSLDSDKNPNYMVWTDGDKVRSVDLKLDPIMNQIWEADHNDLFENQINLEDS